MVELISREMIVEHVARRHPETIKVFVRYSLHCVGCAISPFHTIDQVASENLLDLERLLADLNQALTKEN
jgi:hybrid cluster-associated redox disulfide protein